MTPWCGPCADAPPDLAAAGAGFVGMMEAVGIAACEYVRRRGTAGYRRDTVTRRPSTRTRPAYCHAIEAWKRSSGETSRSLSSPVMSIDTQLTSPLNRFWRES